MMQKTMKGDESTHLVELPYYPFPTLSHPSLYYKVRHRLLETKDVILIGLKIIRVSKYQQDHINYLIQMLAARCPFLKLFTLEPNYVYAEMQMAVGRG
jgi:hypothetical protein